MKRVNQGILQKSFEKDPKISKALLNVSGNLLSNGAAVLLRLALGATWLVITGESDGLHHLIYLMAWTC